MRPMHKLILPAVVLCCALIASCGRPATTEDDIPVTTTSKNARTAFLEGRDAWEAGRSEHARGLFDRATEADPAFALAYLYRARTSSSAVEWKSYVDKAIANKDTASEGEQILIDIIATRLNDDVQGALTLAQKLVKSFPKSARAQHELADSYADLKNIAKSRAALNKATELDPTWGKAFGSLSMSYVFDAPRDFAKAEHYARKYVEIKPKEANAQIVLGDVYRAQVNLEKARDAYAKAAEMDASSTAALSKKGHAETFLGNYDAARTDFAAAADASSTWKIGPKNFAVFTWVYAGDLNAAMAANEALIASIPSFVPDENQRQQALLNTYEARFRIAIEAGAFDIAAEAYSKHAEVARAIAGSMQNPLFTSMTEAGLSISEGYMHAWKGDHVSASAMADKAEAQIKDMNNPRAMNEVHFLRGLVAYLSGKHQDAIKLFAMVGDDMIEAKFYAAMAHDAMGEKDRASNLFKEVANWNFNDLNYALVRGKAVAKLKS